MTEQIAVEASANSPSQKLLSSETATDTKVLVDLKSTVSVSLVALVSVIVYMIVAWHGLGTDLPGWLKGTHMLKAFIEGAAVGALALVTGSIAFSIIVNRNTTVLNNIAQIVKSPPLVISQEQNTELEAVFVREVQRVKDEKVALELAIRELESQRSRLDSDVETLKEIRDGYEKNLDANSKLGKQFDAYRSKRR